MKKWMIIISVSVFFMSGCMDLDQFIIGSIFVPERLDSYQLGAYEEGEFAPEVNALYPDSGMSGNFEEYNFESQGNTIYGYYLHHTGSPGITILYCHGQWYHLDHYWARSKLLYETGYDVFVFDYRGFGKSTGDITEEGMLEDSRQALDFVINTLGVDKSEILLYGYSLGSFPAIDIAANSDMGSAIGLVLEAPIGSIELYTQDATYISIPINFLSEFRMDNISAVKDVEIPVLWLHGDQDGTARLETHGQAIYDACTSSEKQSKVIAGAGHTDIPLVLGGDFSAYITGIKNFIEGVEPAF
jgi:pimeloyl-ACP methyl ester carboxylesterase